MQQESSNDHPADKNIAALFQKALHHFKAGRLLQAREACQHIVRQQQFPDALLVLGMIAHERKELEEAVERYRQYLDFKPGHAQTHYNLGLVLNNQGHTELAIEHLTKSITLAPGNPQAHIQLGDACTGLQRWDQAARAYRQALAMQAGDVPTIIKLGNAYLAEQLFTKAIQLYEQALAKLPKNAMLHRHLGASLHRMGQTEKAIRCFERALSLRPGYVGARVDLALVLRQLGKAEEALAQIEQALADKPYDVGAHVSLALTLRQLGQAELAAERLEKFLGARPACGQAWYHLSLIEPRQAHIPAVKKLVDDPGLPKAEAVFCHFALGNFYRAGKSHDLAFNHYLKANTLQRESFSYDPGENARIFDRLIEVYSRRFIQDKRGFGSASQLPVFIVGLPRSGTTLVEQIASSHPRVHGAGETEAFAGVNLAIAQELNDTSPPPACMSLIDAEMARKYSARYLRELARYSPDAERITDKLPGNLNRIGLIKTLFPDARIIHCRRNPLDNCISLFFHNFFALKCSFDLTELGRYYLDCQRLMSHWQNLFPGEIFTVQYEELVLDQERVSRRLIDYLGLEWDGQCLEFHKNERTVMSPSNMQVRQPMYRKSIDRWKPYEKHLQPLLEVLGSSGSETGAGTSSKDPGFAI